MMHISPAPTPNPISKGVKRVCVLVCSRKRQRKFCLNTEQEIQHLKVNQMSNFIPLGIFIVLKPTGFMHPLSPGGGASKPPPL